MRVPAASWRRRQPPPGQRRLISPSSPGIPHPLWDVTTRWWHAAGHRPTRTPFWIGYIYAIRNYEHGHIRRIFECLVFEYCTQQLWRKPWRGWGRAQRMARRKRRGCLGNKLLINQRCRQRNVATCRLGSPLTTPRPSQSTHSIFQLKQLTFRYLIKHGNINIQSGII